jgi:peptidoglycan/xylan/chitin deacetylase (PgdA/CDA1 family)
MNPARPNESPKAIDLPILLYHHLVDGTEAAANQYEISLRQFEEQLDILRRSKFETIDFRTLIAMMDGREKPRTRVAIITFDDAFRSFYELAIPALQQRGMRATVFVPAGEIGGSDRWNGEKGTVPRELMTEDQLREAAAEGMEIGSHGWAHRSLPECSEAEAREEVCRSIEHLAGLGLRPEVFAYPYGRYSPENIAMVRSAGYSAAVSIFSDAPTVTANRFAMRRIYIHPGDSRWRFRCKLSRTYLRYKAVRGIPNETPPAPSEP